MSDRLRHAARFRNSNVDKKSLPDEERVRLCNYTDVYYNETISDSREFMVATATPSEIERFTLQKDQVLITKDSETPDDIGIPAFVPHDMPGVVLGYHTTQLIPGKRMNGRYLFWWLMSHPSRSWFEISARGVTRFSLDQDAIGDLPVRTPALPSQREIADFLDRETERIDALVDKKRRLIDLLEESVPSLVEVEVQNLLREYPRVPLKHLAKESDLRVGTEEPPELLSVSIHLGVVPRNTITDKPARADSFANYKLCRPGDIVINRMRAFQGGVGATSQHGMVSSDYTVLRLTDRLDPVFTHHLLRSPWFIGEMTYRLRGIGTPEQGNVRTPRVRFADLGEIPFPVPPMHTQQRVASTLTQSLDSTDRLVQTLTTQLSLLGEYREALITAAVTGKINVDTNDSGVRSDGMPS